MSWLLMNRTRSGEVFAPCRSVDSIQRARSQVAIHSGNVAISGWSFEYFLGIHLINYNIWTLFRWLTEDWKGSAYSVRLQKHIYHHLRNGRICQLSYQEKVKTTVGASGEGLMHSDQPYEDRGHPFPAGYPNTYNMEWKKSSQMVVMKDEA